MADGGRRHVVFAQRAQGSQLAQILKSVGLLDGNQFGFFPTANWRALIWRMRNTSWRL